MTLSGAADLNSSYPLPVKNLHSNNYAIIVAGGSGTRMQAAQPKQFLLLHNKPVLMHTLLAFNNSAAQPLLIVVLPLEYHQYWNELCVQYEFSVPHMVVNGGETRFESVKNGLAAIIDGEDAVVAVHDAVRPLVSTHIIDESYKIAAALGNAITVVKSRDSVRQLQGKQSIALVRDDIYLVQTPQTFRAAQLRTAYALPYHEKFTDDASVVEDTGVPVNLIEGNYQNIKITFPEDIAIAEAIIKKGS